MKFTKKVSFDLKSDLSKIKAIAENKIISIAAHRPPGESNSVRLYLLSMDNAPIAVFDDVPYDTFLAIFCTHRIAFDNGQDPEIIKIAAFEGDACIALEWISIPSVIWASLTLSEYCIMDLQFFLKEGLRRYRNAHLKHQT